VRLVLASGSPRRAELLRAAGFAFETRSAEVDERVQPGEAPAAYVRRLAAEKSAAVLALLGSAAAVVLGADTAVVVDDQILGKPLDEDDATAMLRRLSGRSHQVMTGISLRSLAGEVGRVDVTTVDFAALADDEIAWYVSSGEGRDKAGGYAIQGLASRFIPRIDGSYSNVVGLPVAGVVELVRSLHPVGIRDILTLDLSRKSL
jgi:septum formation protein